MANWKGRRTRQWEKIRRALKIRFERVGITRYEFNMDGCWRDNGLSFAHADKRRFLSDDDLWVAALACASCHDKLERRPRATMRELVEAAIKRRLIQP